MGGQLEDSGIVDAPVDGRGPASASASESASESAAVSTPTARASSTRSGAPAGTRAARARAAVQEAVDNARGGVGDGGAGIDRAFRKIFEAYFEALQRFFRGKGFSRQEALDLTQETLLGIYRGWDTYRGESSFRVWMYQIAQRVFLKRLRHGSTHKRAGHDVPLEELGTAEPPVQNRENPLNRLVRQEEMQAMRDAIRDLPEKMRQCLTLRLDQEMSYAQIAVVMKLEINTVKAHLFQARQRLQQRLPVELPKDLDP